MHCQSCGADLPADARFCIECGADVAPPANTGATVQLPRPEPGAVACRACGAANPDFAVYCVRCGQPMAGAPPARGALPGVPKALARSAPPTRLYRGHRGGGAVGRGRSPSWEAIGVAVTLFGLAALFLLKLPIWPGLLLVFGLGAFLSEARRGHYYSALSSVLWLFGLFVLFMVPRLWWPGILVIIGLNVLLDVMRRAARIP